VSANLSVKPGCEGFTTLGTTDANGRRIGVLLSHGFTGSVVSMKPWADHLDRLGFALSVPRLPGHGTSLEDMINTRFSDYYAAVESAYEELAARSDIVFVGGLSMGGGLALWLAANHPEIGGVMLVNAAVASNNKQLMAVPLLKHLVKAMPGIGNDIKKSGQDEVGYDKTPLKPLDSMVSGWKQIRADLGKVKSPVLLFRSVDDHVVDPSSAQIILSSVSSTDQQEILLHNSYHVATLDNDAETIFEESAKFIQRLATSD
jgi:carboxylesterase